MLVRSRNRISAFVAIQRYILYWDEPYGNGNNGKPEKAPWRTMASLKMLLPPKAAQSPLTSSYMWYNNVTHMESVCVSRVFVDVSEVERNKPILLRRTYTWRSCREDVQHWTSVGNAGGEFITSVDLVQSQDNNSAIGRIAKCLWKYQLQL